MKKIHELEYKWYIIDHQMTNKVKQYMDYKR